MGPSATVRLRVVILGAFPQNFVRAVEAGEGLGDLRADADDSENGRDQERQERREGQEVAERERAGEDLARADEHHHRADDAHQHGGRKAHERHGGERLQHVVEQALDAAGEDGGLALLGVIALDDAHAAQRFRQAAGDLGVDLAALAEDRPDLGERLLEREREGGDEQARSDRSSAALMRSSTTSAMTRRQQAADEFHQARADQVAHAFDVGHDARDQHAALVGVVVADRQAADVLLDLLAQLGDQALAGFREQLRERERSDALDERRGQHGQHQRRQQLRLCCLPMTSSIRNLVEYGSTRPLSRLMTISTKPSASSLRRGRIISRRSGQILRKRSDVLRLRLGVARLAVAAGSFNGG